MPSIPSSSHHLQIVDESRKLEAKAADTFDRVAFALRALRALAPRPLTVAVYLRRRGGTDVGTTRDLRRGTNARWALLGVAADATREQIAYALAELAGLERTPFAIECLLAAGDTVSGDSLNRT